MVESPESKACDAAYVAKIHKLYDVLFQNLATGDSPKDCEARFAKGVALARQARDIALKAVTPSKAKSGSGAKST